ncbi:FtsX-like permease family protein [Neobacillus thermocopriae]|uniref:ABC transporter permease n=1 Tax=Neobacillus thermocopriae TaxID=1215031 RepID=A0A6B3TMG7_9BACI|nr:ABC transporter permease [Neobacillus thermocopriae]MED3622575.1 ABC transporter permease [Neobacillus thermocopriae]MED3714334.1 ABC transporter permease [Neobacillus thermocopriae]NEX77868.1 ABC transporter permease [Neobacillus thermocopriae]
MSINQLILRNLKKNLKNYYLYVFALIFSVVLYFSFVTLQYDPSMNEAKGSVKGAAAIRAGSVLLIGIVSVFLLYANTIFIKRRSKEIGLFQLIGMTKGKIFRILSAENFILYFSSLVIGIFLGFSVSRLIVMIVFKITGVEAIAKLHFSSEAFVQTVIVFSAVYLLIMLMNYLFIKRQTILGLFRVQSSTEGNAKKLSIWEMIIGIAGMVFITLGYFISSKLFDGSFTTVTGLFVAMISILILVIVGTYLFYKGSVSFIFHLIRKKKDGYLSIKEVMSLSSIMFRMKSNALLLTIITTVSALAIGLLSLSYISYYSAEQTAKDYVAADFAFIYSDDAKRFTDALEKEGIEYKEKRIEVIQTKANLSNIIDSNLEEKLFNPNNLTLPVVSERAVKHINVSRDEVVLSGYNDLMQRFMPLKDSGPIELEGQKEVIPLKYTELKKDHLVSLYFTFSSPVAIVDETIFTQLKNDLIPDIQRESSLYIGIELKDEAKLAIANDKFQQMKFKGESNSRLEISNNEKRVLGLAMFIVGFLGLTFLITSGCILYFKQMGESEEEKPNYTILRKLGFTQSDLIKGIQGKQLFSFGIPLVVGLSHSYFAVQSGWFLFGTEIWTPMLIVMLLYAALYSIFGILSVFYYKKIIKEAL